MFPTCLSMRILYYLEFDLSGCLHQYHQVQPSLEHLIFQQIYDHLLRIVEMVQNHCLIFVDEELMVVDIGQLFDLMIPINNIA